MTAHIQIGSRTLGPGNALSIVAEAGTTVNGDIKTAIRAIDAAKAARADFIKFMIIGADFFMSNKDVVYEYDTAEGRRSENMYEMFKNLEFSPAEWREIVDHCKTAGMEWFATVDYLRGVDLAETLGTSAYKLSSWDVGNVPLIERMAETGKPIVVDTGPAQLGDLQKVMDTARAAGNEQIVFVHCTHSPIDADVNLRSIPFLQRVFGVPAGFSADERRTEPDIAAVALGACLLEKRLSLDRRFSGHHHVKALEPNEFREYVAMIRRVEAMLGTDRLVASEEDLRMRKLYFVSVVADRDLPKGTVLDESMLACKRPGSGIMPEYLWFLTGRPVRRDIRKNELISWEDV